MRIPKKLSLIVVVVAVVGVGAPSASAETLQPWFHLTSVSSPHNLGSVTVQSEVQELEFAPEALFRLKVGASAKIFATEPYYAVYKAIGAVELTEANVRGALEEAYGASTVKVTPGPGGGSPFRIESVGEKADAPVEPMVVEEFAGPDKVKILTQGRTSGKLSVTAINLGDATANGTTTPVVLTDVLPAGLRVVSAKGNSSNYGHNTRGSVECEVKSAHEVQCTFGGTFQREVSEGVFRTEEKTLPPYDQIEALLAVDLEPGASSGEENHVSVSGGGAPPASAGHPVTIGKAGEATPFGVEDYELSPEEPGGVADTQAGSHPFQLTTTLDLNGAAEQHPAALVKDLTFKLPAGLIGNPTAFAHCTLAQFTTFTVQATNECPAASVLGVAVVSYQEAGSTAINTSANPIYNMEPSPGEAARFAFAPGSVPVFLSASVRTGEDYGVTVHVANIPQTIGFLNNSVTFWGVPGDTRHDNVRNSGCLQEIDGVKEPAPCTHLEQSSPPPFLALPTSCSGKPLETEVLADSWEHPGVLVPPNRNPSVEMPAMDGCGLLPFGSQIKVSADLEAASSPSGLKADVHVPQEEALSATGLAPADLRNITVALPAGVQLNPSAADGLAACSQAQVGLSNGNEASCPNASKIATATIHTPLLPNPLTGFVYLASPQNFAGGPEENPFKSLVAMYLVAHDPVSGVLVKLAGQVSLSATGQITATFANNPQLPFEDAELEFFGGERAPLATPALCRRPGEEGYKTDALFEPWTNGGQVNEKLHATSEFDITSGPNGSACPNGPGNQSQGSLPFAASLSSETTNINAGGFTPLSTTLSRPSGNQSISSVTLHYPAGLSGLLTGVELCPEAQANAGTCGPNSQIGETIVSVGVGGDPFTVTGGKVYLTGPYAGAPFGLSIVNPAKAGPFDLQEGRPVVVRAKVEVNPTTAALTITTNGAGEGHAIPNIIEGFPLQIQHVNVNITGVGGTNKFTFNPTNCTPTAITGTIDSAEGASSPVSVPFQVTNCASLKFTPKFAVSTSGKTSRSKGASLTATVSEPAGSLGTQANLTKVKVELPKQLPSRLTTLQKACTAAQFEANPASCPSPSVIGHAKVLTPLVPVPLEGPVYFVSHGGEAFPSLEIVLQGYGVKIILVGTTFISKSGITSTTFKTVPDQPFNTFAITLPEGKYSALAANGNLCSSKLAMPNEFVGQNGAVIHESTKIGVTGCAKKKALTRAQKLKAALAVCHKQDKRSKARRETCERTAHKRFGPVKKSKPKK